MPEEISIGDTVAYGSDEFISTVKAVHGEWAWCVPQNPEVEPFTVRRKMLRPVMREAS